MKVRVVPAVGGGPPIELDVPPNASIGAVKMRVCAIKKLRPEDARLTFKGRALNDSETIASAGVTEGDKLVLITRTVGG
ncbi:MAG: ubiquitin-like domain-containing protein [Nitrososphaerota archaeon]|nr:ubiquitin family protein [Candidatus Calditenuaceae archaeon]MDW8073129.1 ubiquitin-like domain-containing protein [Nitrososphaerota archaeon]